MPDHDDELFRSTLAEVAPGSVLRDGLERILRGNTGALVVLGHDKLVESLCTGGFDVNIEFSATRLRELAKMDGAVVVDAGVSRILKAAVQLVPDPSIETLESGTRHRTAERVARHVGLETFDVVGHSLGGQAALRLAWRLPDGVRRLVLEEMPPVALEEGQIAETMDLPLTPRRVWLGIKQVVQTPGALSRFDKTMMDSVSPQFQPDPAWWERLSATPQETLVISGGPRDFLRPEYLRLVADALPRGEYVELRGGHTVHRESSAAFARAVLDFLR